MRDPACCFAFRFDADLESIWSFVAVARQHASICKLYFSWLNISWVPAWMFKNLSRIFVQLPLPKVPCSRGGGAP